jgi:hypothetical protein
VSESVLVAGWAGFTAYAVSLRLFVCGNLTTTIAASGRDRLAGASLHRHTPVRMADIETNRGDLLITKNSQPGEKPTQPEKTKVVIYASRHCYGLIELAWEQDGNIRQTLWI